MNPREWVPAITAYLVLSVGLTSVGAPTPQLFAAMVAGGILASRASRSVAVPPAIRAIGLALVGVAAGAAVDTDVVRTIASQPVAVVGGVVSVLVVSALVGQTLRLHRDVSATTAAFASIAGGASGVAMMADELGADAQTVIVVQYLRVVTILVSVPLIAPLLGGSGAGGDIVADRSQLGALGFTVVSVGGGLLLARFVAFSGSGILLPLAVATALSLSGIFSTATFVPDPVLAVGYTIVGFNVGVGFSRDRIGSLARLLPLALAQIVVGVAVCAGLGVVFANVMGISKLDGYLATSPGGLPAVVAVALDSGTEVGLILTMQFLRISAALVAAPVIGRWNRRTLQAPATITRPKPPD